MKFCPQCGSELKEGARFCASCGYQIAPQQQAPPPPTFQQQAPPPPPPPPLAAHQAPPAWQAPQPDYYQATQAANAFSNAVSGKTNLIQRAKNIIIQPKQEWLVINNRRQIPVDVVR